MLSTMTGLVFSFSRNSRFNEAPPCLSSKFIIAIFILMILILVSNHHSDHDYHSYYDHHGDHLPQPIECIDLLTADSPLLSGNSLRPVKRVSAENRLNKSPMLAIGGG